MNYDKNIEKICEILHIHKKDVEEIAEELLGVFYFYIKDSDLIGYNNSRLLVTSILYYFIEFIDPDKYSVSLFENFSEQTEWGEGNKLSYHPVLEEIIKKYLNSKCAYYYNLFLSKPSNVRPFVMTRSLFKDYIKIYTKPN